MTKLWQYLHYYYVFSLFLRKKRLVFKISQKFHTFKAICSNFYLYQLHKIALQNTRTSTFIIKIKSGSDFVRAGFTDLYK